MAKTVKVITHSGRFHTDEVFGTALLLQIYNIPEIIRTRDESVLTDGKNNPNIFVIDGVNNPRLRMIEGSTYNFSNPAYSSHPISFINATFVARKLLDAYLIISDVSIDVETKGVSLKYNGL